MANPTADYPGQLHSRITVPDFTASKLGLTTPKHTDLEGKQEEEIYNIQAKLGLVSSTPSANKLLRGGPNSGESFWDSFGNVAAQLFVNRGQVAGSTTYNKGDIIIYKGRRILATNSFTTGSGINPFISSSNYIALDSINCVYAADFGVSGDGVTDNASALSSAIAYAYALGSTVGGATKVILPPGYVLTSQTVELYTSIWLQGQGIFATVLKLTTNANCDVVKTHKSTNGTSDSNAYYCQISDMTIDGNYTNQNGSGPYYGIRIETNPLTSKASADPYFDPSHVVQNVRIYRAKGDGLYMNGRSDTRIISVLAQQNQGNNFTPSFDTHMIGCVSDSAGLAGFYINHSSVQITNCKAYLSGQVTPNSGHGFYLDSNCSELTITNCDAQQNKGNGFLLSGCNTINLIGCTNSEAGYGNAGTWAGFALDGVTKSIITGTHTTTSSGDASVVSLINSSLNNSIDVINRVGSGSAAAIQTGSAIAGNRIVINGVTYYSSIPLVSKSSAYQITDQDSLILVTGTTTVTLPTAVGCSGKQYTIKNLDSSLTTTIATTSSQTIDGVTTKTLTSQYKFLTVISDNANWHIISSN